MVYWICSRAIKFTSFFAVNTEKRRRVLSHIYLGREIVNDGRYIVDDEFII